MNYGAFSPFEQSLLVAVFVYNSRQSVPNLALMASIMIQSLVVTLMASHIRSNQVSPVVGNKYPCLTLLE